jgi:hypothetical protein
LGSPGKLAQGFKLVYQPDGLIDFLLVAIPLLLNTSLNLLLVNLMPRYPWADVRLVILFHSILVAIGLWRRSTLLALFWMPRIAVQIMAAILAEQGWVALSGWTAIRPVTAETVYLSIYFCGLIYLYGRIVWRNRYDLFTVTYALIPFIMGLLIITIDWSLIGRIVFASYDVALLQVYINFFTLLNWINIAMLAVLFLVKNRTIRWAALGISGLLIGSFISIGTIKHVLFLWIILPAVAIVLGWWLDQTRWQKIRSVP